MIPKDILKKIKPWMWLSTYIVLLLFALVHFQDLMGPQSAEISLGCLPHSFSV